MRVEQDRPRISRRRYWDALQCRLVETQGKDDAVLRIFQL